MRVLLYPVYNQHVLKADSIYHITESLARHLAEVEGWHVYWVVPLKDRVEGETLTWYKTAGTAAGGDGEMPAGVTLLHRELYTSYRLQEVTSPQWLVEQFHPLRRETTPLDVVITTSSIQAHFLKQLFSEVYNRADPVPVVSWDLLLRGGSGAKEVTSWGESEIILQTLGQLVTTPIFESPIARDISVENARAWLKGSAVAKLMKDHGVVIPLGANLTKVDRYRNPQRDQFTVFFGGRFTQSKGVDFIAETADYIYRRGLNIRIEMTTGTGLSSRAREILAEHSSINIHTGLTQAEAFGIMTASHAFICASKHELFGGAFWEQLYAGLLGIFKRSPWNEGLLPPDYPLVFDTLEEAYALLKDVQDNYSSWKERLVWVPDWVRDNYSYQVTFAQFAQTVQEVAVASRAAKTNDEGMLYKAVLEGAGSLSGPFSLAELEARLIEKQLVSTGGISGDGNPARIRSHISRHKLHRILMNSGLFSDDTTFALPRYSKK